MTTTTEKTTKTTKANKTTNAKKIASNPKKAEKVKTEIANNGTPIEGQAQFPEFLKDLPQVLDPQKLSNQLDKTTEYIRKEVGNVAKSFCRIGFKLWDAKENKLYLGKDYKDYKNIYEYAENVLGFKKSSTAGYIAICERFSIRKDGKPTAQLQPSFASFSYTQLSLMLSVPDEKLNEITPETSCKQIREIKRDEKESESESNAALEEYKASAKPPIQIFNRVLTEQNIDMVIKLLRENIGREFQILIEDIE